MRSGQPGILTWQGIKQIILIKDTNYKQLNGLKYKINNTIANDRKPIATVAKKIDKKIPKSKRTYTDYLKNRNFKFTTLSPKVKLKKLSTCSVKRKLWVLIAFQQML